MNRTSKNDPVHTSGNADATPEDPMTNSQSHHAGAYGFSTRETRGLVFIAVIALSLGLLQWWHRQRDAVPHWAVETIVVGAQESIRSEQFRARSPATDSASSINATTTDINNADWRALVRLPGIGPELARRIIEDRERHGTFENLIDLQRVRGIGPKKAAVLGGWVRFSQSPPVDSMSPE